VKYTNHLNVIVAIIGVIVIAQTLTRTFWNSAPEKKYSLELPSTQPEIKVQSSRPVTGQRRSAGQVPAALPGTVRDPSSQVGQPAGSGIVGGGGRLLPAPTAQPSSNPGLIGAPSGTAAAPNVVTIPSAPTTASPTGSRPQVDGSGRSLRGQVPFGARSTFRSQRGADSRGTNLPPPAGNDAGKRQLDPNAPAPPVRSSMPEQRTP